MNSIVQTRDSKLEKLTALIIAGISVISLAAHANPHLANGSWVGSYMTSNPACGAASWLSLIEGVNKIIFY